MCQQLGNACTVGARAIMHLAVGADVLVRPPTPLIKMFYQDTDSNYNCINVVRKWRERGLYGDELGQFKNDTVKDGDGVGVLGYFLQHKLKIYFARDLGRGRWTRKVTAKGWAVKNIPPPLPPCYSSSTRPSAGERRWWLPICTPAWTDLSPVPGTTWVTRLLD